MGGGHPQTERVTSVQELVREPSHRVVVAAGASALGVWLAGALYLTTDNSLLVSTLAGIVAGSLFAVFLAKDVERRRRWALLVLGLALFVALPFFAADRLAEHYGTSWWVNVARLGPIALGVNWYISRRTRS